MKLLTFDDLKNNLSEAFREYRARHTALWLWLSENPHCTVHDWPHWKQKARLFRESGNRPHPTQFSYPCRIARVYAAVSYPLYVSRDIHDLCPVWCRMEHGCLNNNSLYSIWRSAPVGSPARAEAAEQISKLPWYNLRKVRKVLRKRKFQCRE